MSLSIKIRNTSPFPYPAYATPGSAGMDIQAHLPAPIVLRPMERCLIPTGLFLELPQGYEAQIRPRSGLALRKGLTILNAPGTIDSDYRGEVGVILVNLSSEEAVIEPGDRIAQMVIARYEKVVWQAGDELNVTERGSGGFGSTGFGGM